jgi:hypothetical protein
MEVRMALHYQITVIETLDESWSDWFDGLTITHNADGNTLMTGKVRDQSALYGLIDKARDLALTLVAVGQVTPLSHDGLDPPPKVADATLD